MSQISPPIFFSLEKALLSWTQLLRKTPRRTKVLIFPGRTKILKIWDILFRWYRLKYNAVKLFQNFFITKSWNFWKNIEKETAKATPKIEKIYILNIYREQLFCLQSNASGSFLPTCINFVEQRLKFSHFVGSIIP